MPMLGIPSSHPIPSGACYRKYDPVSGWREFVINANNALASAPGECPLPGDPAYTPGLTAGHYCIQITLQDGGLNDTDGLANHVIEDPGQLALVEGSAPPSLGATPSSALGGGGAVEPVFLLYLVAMIIGIRRMHQGKIQVDSRLSARYD